MKRFFILMILGILLATITYSIAEEKLEKITLKIEGMTLSCCALIIRDALLKTNGVKRASVSFEDALGVVEFEADKVTTEQLVEVVKEAGYKGSIKEMGKRYEMPKEAKKEIENKFRELSKKYKIPEEDLEEHWNFVRKEAEKVFESCCEWALSRGMKMEDAESYCKSAILVAIGEFYLSKQIF